VFGGFIGPESIAVYPSRNTIYVDDTGNNVIKVFDLSSVCPPVFSEVVTGVCSTASIGLSNLSSPHGVAVDSSHNVYVADTGNNRVLKFDSNGELIANWGLHGALSLY
jgi:DNA-binding beta-propeller fold protein YncE